MCKNELNYQFEFGFACQKETCQVKYSKESTLAIAIVELEHNFCPKVMCCKSCGKPVSLNYNQLLWFIPFDVLDLLKKEVSMYFVAQLLEFFETTSALLIVHFVAIIQYIHTICTTS